VTEGNVDYATRYPLLHAAQHWPDLDGHGAVFSTEPPADDLVTNVHVVAFVEKRIVVCREAQPMWFLPGGTRECGESIEDCAARELAEEAGVSLVGPLTWIGAHYCTSTLQGPYRAWQPHPNRAMLWCYADVRQDGEPTNPAHGEQVVEVHLAEPDEAQVLVGRDDPWIAELVALARELRTTDD
jgi:8-oxo-dGTP diphosphatase